MNIPRHPTLIRRMRDARLRRLTPRRVPLGASLGRQRGGGCHLTIKEDGKTRTVYVPKERAQQVRASIREYRRIKRLLGEITRLEMALVRLHRTEKIRRGTRR